MEVLQYVCRQVKHSRDILNFMTLRDGQFVDDQEVGDFLLKTFAVAGTVNVPEEPLLASRVKEILNVPERRKNGMVKVLELGRKIIGSYSLVRPGPFSSAWNRDASYFCAFGIDPSVQRLGLANILMADAQLTSLAWDLPVMDFKVVKSAKKLHDFYENMGFRPDPNGDCSEHGFELLGFSGAVSHGKAFELLSCV